MTARMLAWLSAAVVALVAVCAGLTGALFFGPSAAAACQPATGPSGTPAPGTIGSSSLPKAGRWDAEQLRNAATIISVGAGRKVPTRGWVIAVATAIQESDLHNLGDLGPNNDHDSLGLFQQRPSQGWGTPAQVMDPIYASTKFYEKLVQIPDWEKLPLTEAAQRVQRSAFPDAYAKRETAAQELVAHLGAGAIAAGGCTVEISAQGWTQPVRAEIVSGFRTEERPGHNGVDLSVPKKTPIHAAATGRVVQATCNAHVGGSPYSCNIDGSPSVAGCGWYVDIEHDAGVVTRYCHMLIRPHVQIGQQVFAGQVVGISGTSGNSSGPHLHFEVHAPEPESPVVWMTAHGAPLGRG